MKLSIFMLGAALVWALPVAAQQTPAPQVQPRVFIFDPAQPIHLDTCPVHMQARQGGLRGMVKVRKGDPQSDTLPKPGQRILLILNRDLTHIARATVTVRGLSARGRVQNTFSAKAGDPDLRRTLDVALTPDGSEDAAELILPGFTSVTSVQLDSVTYADGIVWQAPPNHACSVAPDGIMLVGLK